MAKPSFPFPSKGGKKKQNPALEKAEEKFGDLDGDNEKNESPKHQKKVAAADKKNASDAEAKAGAPGLARNPKMPSKPRIAKIGTNIPPRPQPKMAGGKGNGKMCADCKKSGKSSCNH